MRLCCVAACAVISASALAQSTIYLDRIESSGGTESASVFTGAFTAELVEEGVNPDKPLELIALVTGSDFAAAGADGLGRVRLPARDVSLGDICAWLELNSMPDDRLDILVDVIPPAGDAATTAVIKHLAVRLGEHVHFLGDELVVDSRARKAPEARLGLALDYKLGLRASDNPESFRISAEVGGPPGTVVVFYLTGTPRHEDEQYHQNLAEYSASDGIRPVAPSLVSQTPPIRRGSAPPAARSGGVLSRAQSFPFLPSPEILTSDDEPGDVDEPDGPSDADPETPSPTPIDEAPEDPAGPETPVIDETPPLEFPDDLDDIMDPDDSMPPDFPDGDPPGGDPPPIPEPASSVLVLTGAVILLRRASSRRR